MAEQKVKIKFTRNYRVQDDEGKEYEAGQSVTLPESSANHFLRREVAVVDESPTKKASSKSA
jgi:hypothetical protein